MLNQLSEDELSKFLDEHFEANGYTQPSKLDMSPEEASQGLAQLALTIVNLLKEVMEKQAMRKMDREQLSEEQVEKLGTTFMLLDERMTELKQHFGLSDDDLSINLGPLGEIK